MAGSLLLALAEQQALAQIRITLVGQALTGILAGAQAVSGKEQTIAKTAVAIADATIKELGLLEE